MFFFACHRGGHEALVALHGVSLPDQPAAISRPIVRARRAAPPGREDREPPVIAGGAALDDPLHSNARLCEPAFRPVTTSAHDGVL